MTDSLKRVAALSPEQRDLLLRRLARADPEGRDRPPQLVPRERGEGDEAPLSFAQERMWFLDRLAPGDPALNIGGGLRLEGRLSTEALSAAVDEIVRRHEVLRANFLTTAGRPVQMIRSPAPFPIEVVDLSTLASEARESESRRLYLEEIRRGFDLARDRLLRTTLIRLAREEHLLLVTLHHIVSDGWSIGVVMAEMEAFYGVFAASEGPDLQVPDLEVPPIQYADFAAWQRQRMEGDALERGLAYWRGQLESPPPVLELPADRVEGDGPPATGRHLDGATVTVELDRELKDRLDELSRQEDTSLFVTMLSAFAALLMRCTGREDILVGSPVSGRTRVETEGLIGLFLNTLALRARLSPKLPFRRALALMRQTVLEGLAHHDVPFERVVQDLDPERSSTRHPLFEILFNFTPRRPPPPELPGLHASFEEPPGMAAQYTLELYVMERERTLELKLLYPVGRYSESRMAILLEQLQAILQQVARDADLPLGALDLSTPRSRALLPDPTLPLEEPVQVPVPQSLAEWARRTPDQPAVRQGGTSLTYAQLQARITAVADHLRGRGLAPGQVVAVLGPRSPGVVVSMSGVLAAGGVLLTLSPDLPEERHRQMLREAGCGLLIRVGDPPEEDPWLTEWRAEGEGPEIAGVDTGGDLVDPGDRAERVSPPSPTSSSRPPAADGRRDPAYIFFTSGSSGKPKAVLGCHSGLAHFLAWQRRTFGVGPGDRCGQLTDLSFDVVLRDIFLPLTSGATLVLPGDGDFPAGGRILRWLEEERITHLHTVPTVAETWLLDRPPEVTLASLKCVFFAGEPLTSALLGRWREAFPRVGELVNLYGPTETTLAKCHYRVPPTPPAGIQPLGRALPETQLLVLTPDLRLCGIGEPGEIAIRTPFRSLGYLNAPQENEARLIPNPFAGDPDDRIYLTGDRGAYGADGLLEFLGRLDHQVKVRGVRVEPAEVSAALAASPDVSSCAVVALGDDPGGPVLVAYVVTARDTVANAGRLQAFLRRSLPASMVPAAFVFLDTLPLTPNQKLDRERLPAPDGERPSLEGRYQAPRDAKELQLVQIWEELLGVRPVGVTDSFFDLGGHSLMGLHLLALIEERLGKKVPLPALLEQPTIEHLAAVTRQVEDEWPRVVTLWRAEHRRKLFLAPPGGGVLWNYIPLIRHLAPEMPVYGLQAWGLDGESEPHQDLEEMAAAYVEEVRRLQPEGPYFLGGHSLGGKVAFEMARQLQGRGHEVALLAMFDSKLTESVASEGPAGNEGHGDARSLADMAATIERFVGKRLGVTYETLRDLSTDEQIECVVEAMERSHAITFGSLQAMTRNLLDVSKAQLRASRGYRPGISPVPITLFRALESREPPSSSPGTGAGRDDSLGWSAVSTEPVRIHWTPGDHVTIMAEPHVEALAGTLRSCLTEALGVP